MSSAMQSISGMRALLLFLLGGGAVALSAIVSRAMGGRIGGIFAAFPAVFLSAVIGIAAGLHGSQATRAALTTSHGALVGMIANIACAAVCAATIPRMGWKRGLAVSIIIWLVLASLIYAGAFRLGLVG